MAAAVMLLVGAPPAHAAVREVAGSHSCPSGQHIYVSVSLEAVASEIRFFRGTSTLQDYVQNFGGFTEHYSGYRSGSWRVTTTGSIRTVSDGCAIDPSLVEQQ